MARIRNTFFKGIMNKDLDSRLTSPDLLRDALNVKVSTAASDDVGVVENNLSNKKLTDLDLGANPKTIGMYFDNVAESIYWFVVSDQGRYILEYDTQNKSTSFVLREEVQNVLGFDENFLITGVNLVVDSDNQRRFLLWNDNLNPPRLINIERAKTYGLDNFTKEQISLIKPPPIFPPELELLLTPNQGSENNIQQRFIRFAYRYQYLDGEYSTLSSFTNVAFSPLSFLYDYGIQSNESMINAFNQANLTINTGSDLVVAVDLVFKDDNSNTLYIVDHYIKSKVGWANNTDVTIAFVNNKIFKALDSDQLLRLYDAVPLKAKAQEIINNRLILANYTENYNLVDADGNPIAIDFHVERVSTAIPTPTTPTPSLKSNRDYEIGKVYLDLQGRMTTVLTSVANTAYIPNINSIDQNQLKVTIPNLAPEFAYAYRFFIKQPKVDYDVLVATVFYNDGIYVWVLLLGNEGNKVSEGDFIYVKSDTQEILTTVAQTRVLELKLQPLDFLDNGENQVPGLYMRVSPEGYQLNEADYTIYNFIGYDSSSNSYDNPIRGQFNAVELAVYYGLNGLNDMTSGGTYTGTEDKRYLVDINATGATDRFRWSGDNGVTWSPDLIITGVAQVLELGVEVTFAAITGHVDTDQWVVSAKASDSNGLGTDENSKAYAMYVSLDPNGLPNVDDVILGGSQIKIIYTERGEAIVNFERTYISSRQYANLEEWWYGDSIQDDFFRDKLNVWFRRGVFSRVFNVGNVITQSVDGTMILIIRSVGTQNNDLDGRAKVWSSLEIISLDQIIIFETIPLNDNANVFFEIGKTYLIDENRNHLGGGGLDIDQTSVLPAQITLDVFNCFAWGNGFESYKIKDLFNANSFKVSGTRPSSTIEDYRENTRIASLTYGKVYEQTTNFNGLNEFNLSTANFKDIDDKYESIQRLYSRDTNLVVFQEDKVIRIPYTKDLLLTAQGDINVVQSTEILGTEASYSGEYGISKNPESFAFYGNAIYFTDSRRAVVCRLDLDGITEISGYGMSNFFEDDFRDFVNNKKVGSFDLFNQQYVLSGDQTVDTTPLMLDCGDIMFQEDIVDVFTYQLKINNLEGDVVIGFNITLGSATITASFNGSTYSTGVTSGLGTLEFERDSLIEDVVTITITPSVSPTSFQLSNSCPLGTPLDIINVITNSEGQQGKTMTSRYKWGFSGFFSEIETFQADGLTLFQLYSGVRGVGKFPFIGQSIEMQAYKDASNNGSFGDPTISLGYLVSPVVYGQSDILTIRSLATFLPVQVISAGSIPETHRGNFVFNPTSINDKLYLLWDYTELIININTFIYIFFDSSGSMDETLDPLTVMRDTLLRDALLPFYNDDVDLYNSRVVIVEQGDERTLDMLNVNGVFPPEADNIISLVFQDEASPVYMPSIATFNPAASREPQYNTDLSVFRSRLSGFTPDFYFGVVFQVTPNSGNSFENFLLAVQNGVGNYSGANGLSDKSEVIYNYNVADGNTPQYYLDLVLQALTDLGFDLNP
jgi:hypothetical protein